MHDNPDVSRFVIRIDSFGPHGEPGPAPTAEQLEKWITVEMRGSVILAEQGLRDVNVEVEERLA